MDYLSTVKPVESAELAGLSVSLHIDRYRDRNTPKALSVGKRTFGAFAIITGGEMNESH